MFGLEPLPRSLEAALRDVKHDKERVRISALGDLARHAADVKDRRARAAITTALARDPSPDVRAAAAVALADAGARDEMDAVLRATDDPDASVRQMALVAVGELGQGTDARVTAVISAAVANPAAAIRYQGLIAASALGLPFAEKSLVKATGDADEAIRHIGLRLLEERATSSGQRLTPAETVVRAARDRLSDPSMAVRVAAAILLGRAGDSRGSPVLVEAVATLGAPLEPEDEQAAIGLAGELQLRDAIPGLERRAFRPFGRATDFAYEARIALARMGHARARAAIVKDLSAFTRDQRTLAVAAAARAGLKEALPIIENMEANERRADPVAVRDALLALRDSPEG